MYQALCAEQENVHIRHIWNIISDVRLFSISTTERRITKRKKKNVKEVRDSE